MLYVGLIVLPISIYFYVWHGDWFLLYLADVRRIPSALALVGFAIQAAIAAGGFALGAMLVRSQRETVAGITAGALLLLSALIVIVARDRLSRVGTYAQFQGGFGLAPYGGGALLPGTIVMGVLMLAGLSFLLLRLYYGGKRI
jgi:hypothetical protein